MTTTTAEMTAESHVFEADVARLLHMMVHSVYSDKDVFLRELISNAADACEKLRYEAIAQPGLLANDPDSRILLTLDADGSKLIVEDNGIGMSRDEMIEALGTIARSGTRAFMERSEANKQGEGAQLIGQFGVGFYSCFMVADRVDVVSRRAGAEDAWLWSSDGKGGYSVAPVDVSEVREAAGDEDALVATNRALFTARVDPQTKARVGSTLRLAVDPAAFHYFDPASGLRSERVAAPALAGA